MLRNPQPGSFAGAMRDGNGTRKLHHERVVGPGGEPERWLYVLPGIFGAGRNWGSVGRRLVRERPDWGVSLVDLRQHGMSQGFQPPHTVQAAAADLEGLAAVVPPDALLGHSFGGKVALLAAAQPHFRGRVRQLWIIDSTPDAGPPAGSAWQMLLLLQRLPDDFASRAELVGALTTSRVSLPIAQWMATNLHHVHGRYRWRFDRDAMEALLRSFFDTDAWAVVEAPPPGPDIHFVRATESSVMSPEAVGRARRAGEGGRVHVHDVAGGHWLNADNPDTIVHLLVHNLPR